MKHIEIKGQIRSDFGKKASADLRRQGMIPCTICGGKESTHFAVTLDDFNKLIFTPKSFIVDFNIDGKKDTAVLREVQYQPVTDEAICADFYRVQEGKPVSVPLPIKITGHSEGVKQGGKFQLVTRKLFVSGLAENLPDEIEVDITTLQIGKTIRAGELNLENLTILNPASTPICAVKSSRGAAAATAEEESAE